MESPRIVIPIEAQPKQLQQYTCNDLSFTAYLISKGANLVLAKKLGKTYVFTVDLNGLNPGSLKIQFVNSDVAKFDQAVKNLKKIIYSGTSQI